MANKLLDLKSMDGARQLKSIWLLLPFFVKAPLFFFSLKKTNQGQYLMKSNG